MTEQRATLRRDITAAEMAVDSVDGDGYAPTYVIGSAGSQVTVVSVDGDTAEVCDFDNDPFVEGFVQTEDLILEGK